MPHKPHPVSLLLIEPDASGMWRFVARETTRTGLRRGWVQAISEHPTKDEARAQIAMRKQKPQVVTL